MLKKMVLCFFLSLSLLLTPVWAKSAVSDDVSAKYRVDAAEWAFMFGSSFWFSVESLIALNSKLPNTTHLGKAMLRSLAFGTGVAFALSLPVLLDMLFPDEAGAAEMPPNLIQEGKLTEGNYIKAGCVDDNGIANPYYQSCVTLWNALALTHYNSGTEKFRQKYHELSENEEAMSSPEAPVVMAYAKYMIDNH